MCEGFQSDTNQVSQFYEPSAGNTTYLGKVNMTSQDAVRAQEQYTLKDHSKITGTLLDGTNCEILLDRGAVKRFI